MKPILRIMADCCQNRIHRRLFGEDNLRSCLWCNSFLFKTQDYSIHPRNQPNSIRDVLMRGFEISAPKALKNIEKKNYVAELIARLKTKPYYSTKNSTSDTFLEVSRTGRTF